MSKVEDVARAICFKENAAVWNCACAAPAECKKWQGFDDSARAAIAAMRTPTEAMIEAGESETKYEDIGAGDFERGWMSACEAALMETP